MRTAIFINYSKEDFTGFWNGRGYLIKAKQQKYMPDYLAKHFAKHLANRELLRTDANGNLVVSGGDKATSPKVKLTRDGTEYIENQLFLKYYEQGFKILGDEESISDVGDEVATQMDVAERTYRGKGADGSNMHSEMPDNRSEAQKVKQDGEPGNQVIVPPDFDEDDEEAEFEGKPTE